MIIVYAAHKMAPFQFEYNKQPKPIVDSTDDFYFQNHITNDIGDSTVLASQFMAPVIKWIYEHHHGLTNIPTKLVEYCSQYNGDAVCIIYL
ncbi:unnamed protein product [Paramecium sonneborni]|uniref:Uncharacterized protein n=1 Tax=Paramecium sonneborni TaxID=65129 RepID=A0A8S1QW26_9CILI|nr:unnamed protein product [Paramecium sonneborni]